MPGLIIAASLIASLLLVHFSIRNRPLGHRPLDVDSGLPLPEVGQASTVFSLTALFGAYFGIYLVLGLPALAGVSFGTVLSLFAIRRWIRNSHATGFESYLGSVFDPKTFSGVVFAVLISVLQCFYAASELLILQEIAKILFGLTPTNASLFAIGAAVVGYFYVLLGGYLAVYRTDIVQFFFVFLMAAGFGIYALSHIPLGSVAERIWPRPGYWEPLFFAKISALKYFYQFGIGTLMGFGFLSAAPDAWKRVYVATTLRGTGLRYFIVFIGVGLLPFLALLPVVFAVPNVPDGPMNMSHIVTGFPSDEALFVVGALGLLGSFLSAFDSAAIASVQVGIMLRRGQTVVQNETSRYHWLMLSFLLATALLFKIFLFLGNPYMLGTILLGPYAIVGGIQIGAGAKPARLPGESLLWITTLAIVAWVIYLAAHGGFEMTPTTYLFNLVPAGAGLGLIVCVACRLALIATRQNQ